MQPLIPNMAQLSRYEVNNPNQYEAVRQPLYDFQTYASAGQVQLNFFQVQIGSAGKTIDDTNMELAGTLPRPKHFLVEIMEIHFYPGVNPVTQAAGTVLLSAPNYTNDVLDALKLGSVDFFIGSKSYLKQASLMRFPPSARLAAEFGVTAQMGQAAAANLTLQITAEYAAAAGRPFMIMPRILLITQQNFKVSLNWSAAVPLPSAVNARIGVVLDGIEYRWSQ